MIEIRNLKKYYGERAVVDIDDLKVEDGTTLAFAGANGSGKTTLLRILAHMLSPTEGDIQVPDNTLYMPQQSYAFRGDLIKNITVGGGDKKKAETMLKKLGLSHLAEKSASSLSGGELQRLSLCRILVRNCKLLLLDEPTSACDAEGAQLVIKAIEEYRNENNATVIMTTHSPALAVNAADRLIILNSGKIEADGTPGEILNKPESEWTKTFIAGWKIDA